MLPAAPPSASQSGLPVREGARGWPVYAMQSALVDAGGVALERDGHAGPRTIEALVGYQRRADVAADGVCGPKTWRLLTAGICRRLHRALPQLPAGLPEGFARGEGGNNPAAVNWTVAGGVDCGLWQLRCYGPPYDPNALRRAFSPYRAGLMAMGGLLEMASAYLRPHADSPFSPLELAVLHHNWPWAATEYHRRGRLPNPLKAAPWVPAALPPAARTYDGWARFYVAAMTE